MATVTTITPAQAPELITDVMRAGLVAMLTSSPGIGKSSIAKQIAETNNLKVIDVRLSQCDPTDLGGFPAVDLEAGKASYLPMSTFPIITDELPRHLDEKGRPKPVNLDGNGEDQNAYSGWLLLLDEFNSAPTSVQAAAYKIVLDKQVGMHDLHPRVKIMCAGNLATDKAIVNRLSTAMQSRLIHLELEVNHTAWMDWAASAGIDYRVTSFLNFKKDALQKFDPKHSDKTFACPRTWEFLSDIIKPFKTLDASKSPLVMGTIGEGVGTEFTSFCAIFNELPTMAQILKNPTGTVLPTQPAIQFAITGLVANNFDSSNGAALMPFIDRLPIEFQIILLRGAIKIDTKLVDIPSVQSWITKNAAHLC